MKNWFFLLLALSLVACGGNNNKLKNGSGGYQLTDVSGSNWQRAMRKDVNGNLLESGFFANGKKAGTWLEYAPGNEFPTRLISYAEGEFNGLTIQFSNVGQIEIMANYLNNKLDGRWVKYRFARPEEEANYKDGQLDGDVIKYDIRNGQILSSAQYKEGKMHGIYRTYNEAGQITTEYEYRNGQQVRGGIVNPSDTNAPR